METEVIVDKALEMRYSALTLKRDEADVLETRLAHLKEEMRKQQKEYSNICPEYIKSLIPKSTQTEIYRPTSAKSTPH